MNVAHNSVKLLAKAPAADQVQNKKRKLLKMKACRKEG